MSIVVPATPDLIQQAARLIRAGQVVVMPTETVYGLGADAFNAQAVAQIFALKNRPHFNPLISHIADIDFLPEYAKIDERVRALAQRFWPGPLTFVLNRKEHNPALDLACAGLRTITVRMPNHPVALNLIRTSGTPIVAPSANLFQTISPTSAALVFQNLGNRVSLILDGGPCAVGVESTILDLTTPRAVLLRPGGIDVETLSDFLGEPIHISDGTPDAPTAPGQLRRHYAPNHPLRINVQQPNPDEFYIGFGAFQKNARLNLSPDGDLCEAASRLFAYLYEADRQTEYAAIAVAPIPNTGLGMAINDRLQRASYQQNPQAVS